MPEPVMSADGSGQRLMITSIDVENFKSYYGKHVLGPFHQVGCFYFCFCLIYNNYQILYSSIIKLAMI